MRLTVYLAGQIHSPWREEFKQLAEKRNLPLDFVGPMDNHDRSDDIGEEILGPQPNAILKDEAASQINNLRTRVLMNKADVVVAVFGEKYKQWNAAMDAGIAIALNKPLILVRAKELHHALKEIANNAQVVVETPEQAIEALAYIFAAE
ncbi:YtoQ family protein [Caldalkalibacillus uzonensis]|uniref:YtoQ family protein n=1 Tax=Caldalkalibacillus uzonensis TaxID=353224 RepID=A0ABU0CTS7_9BACI|nr:YtoQ family protein [Caldalkalibacillus uzonensis]MDQ0338910.1 YtoQ family protein [Caldalkalibacillus uzonensis]